MTHKKFRKSCKFCTKIDDQSRHRFHGRGSFCETHHSKHAGRWCSWSISGLTGEEKTRRKYNYLKPRQAMTRRIWRKTWKKMPKRIQQANISHVQQHRYQH